jgi:hypothetical protein|tara:strand:+ start:142 stop:501 length:360 start_codon:yes stop_codon:yes gene_type:complete
MVYLGHRVLHFPYQFSKFYYIMSDTSYDSVLVGYTEEPRMYEGQLSSWSVKLKDTELKEMLEKYTTTKNAEGQGGNVYLKLFMSKNGKPCCSVFDPNSEAAKQKRAERKQKAESSDLPF